MRGGWLLAVVLGGSAAYGCDCTEPSVKVKRDHSDIVFRGTIMELRASKAAVPLSELGLGNDTSEIAVFRVGRIWKGDVGETFEMPAFVETSACMGFWPDFLHVGSELIVYATRRGSVYYTQICGFHKPVRDDKGRVVKDVAELGPGKPPKKKR